MGNVIDWMDHQREPVATCKCGCTKFYILVDGYGDKWGKITGTECSECGDKVLWVIVEKN